MKSFILLSLSLAFVIFTSNFSFALKISTKVEGELNTGSSSVAPYVVDDEKSDGTGSIFSYIDQSSDFSSLETGFPPLSVNLTANSFAFASDSGLLSVGTLAEKPFPDNTRSRFTAFSSWQDVFTNNGTHEQTFYLDLAVSSIDMSVSKVFGGDATAAYVDYEARVLLNGEAIWTNSYGFNSYDLENHRNVENFNLQIPETVYNISLGTYVPGESFLIEYQAMAISGMHDSMDMGAGVGPFTVSGNVRSTEPIPEPSTILLLSSGLLGLCWLGRKRNKS